MVSEVYFTPREAAEYLRTSVSTLAKLRVYGGGPEFTRIGRAIRYPRNLLDSYMTSRIVRSTSDKPNSNPGTSKANP
jgi:excisionase family DNA binding protein